MTVFRVFNPLNAELNPICHLLALLAHLIFHVSRIKVKIDLLKCCYLARKTLILTYTYIYIFSGRVHEITALNSIVLITIYLYMLRAFANSRKAPVTFVMPIRPYQRGSQ